jgi:hypothetical protein
MKYSFVTEFLATTLTTQLGIGCEEWCQPTNFRIVDLSGSHAAIQSHLFSWEFFDLKPCRISTHLIKQAALVCGNNTLEKG